MYRTEDFLGDINVILLFGVITWAWGTVISYWFSWIFGLIAVIFVYG